MWKTRVTQLSVKKQKNLSSLSCQLSAEEAYTTVSCNDSVVLSNRLSRWARKSKNKRTCFDAGWPWGKRKSRLLWLDGIQVRSPNIFCTVVQCWQSKAKLRRSSISDEFEDDVKHRRSIAHKVTTRRFCPQHPTLTPGAGSKTEVGPSIPIYIYRDRKPSQHVTEGLAWGSPQLLEFARQSGPSLLTPSLPPPPPPLSLHKLEIKLARSRSAAERCTFSEKPVHIG